MPRFYFLLALPLLLLTSGAGAEEVTEAYRGSQFHYPCGVSVDYNTGWCWVADTLHNEVAVLDWDGTELWRKGGFDRPYAVAADPRDGTVWVADTYNHSIVHLASDLTELWRSSRGWFNLPHNLSLNAKDGSVWVADEGSDAVTHLSEDGEMLADWGMRGIAVFAVAVNEADGTCWVSACHPSPPDSYSVLMQLAPDGTRLFRLDNVICPGPIAVNPADATVWTGGPALLHLTSGGVVLQHTEYYADALAVHPTTIDGTVWLGAGDVYHLTQDGAEKWASYEFANPQSVSVNYRDGSCWVADTYHCQVVHLGMPPRPFPDVPPDYWAWSWIGQCAEAGIVSGYDDGLYHPDRAITRDQMAVFISRALAGGESYVPSGPATATFDDVPTDYWAYKYVEYVASLGVVGGYTETEYRPAVELDRGQMAVFVARAICDPVGEGGLAGYTPPAMPTFPDVDGGFWAYKYVEYIADPARAVAGGYPDGTYRPAVICTRDQMAVYVARAFPLPPYPGDSGTAGRLR